MKMSIDDRNIKNVYNDKRYVQIYVLPPFHNK